MGTYSCMMSAGEKTGSRSSGRTESAAGYTTCGAEVLRKWLLWVTCACVYLTTSSWRCRAGDGKHFPRNPRAEEMLARLALELVKADRSN